MAPRITAIYGFENPKEARPSIVYQVGGAAPGTELRVETIIAKYHALGKDQGTWFEIYVQGNMLYGQVAARAIAEVFYDTDK